MRHISSPQDLASALLLSMAEVGKHLLHSLSRLAHFSYFSSVAYEFQLRSLTSRCSLVVATPGRLRDISDRAHLSFAGVEHVVLDEADRMLDMGFEPQMRAILEHPRKKRTNGTNPWY